MKDYHCPNEDCQETWEQNSKGNLMPGFCISGHWENISNEYKNCPQCDSKLEDWMWVKHE